MSEDILVRIKRKRAEVANIDKQVDELMAKRRELMLFVEGACPHPHVYRKEWEDMSDNIWLECELCGKARVVGEIHNEPKPTYHKRALAEFEKDGV